MKISELQEQLEKVKQEHGDIVVTMLSWEDPNMPTRVGNVEAVDVKKHYDVYARVDRLLHGGWGSGPMFTSGYLKRITARPTLTVAFISPENRFKEITNEDI